jgi:hypothetical protein
MPSARALGIDRRTVPPALLVLALAAAMSLGLPALDSATAYGDAMHRGDVVELAAGITLVPTPGWDLASGVVAGTARTPVGSTNTTELVHGSVDLSVQAAPFAGTASSLLTRINRIDDELERARGRTAAMTGRYAVTTRQRGVGVGEDFVSTTRQGSVVAFVFKQGRAPREGVEVLVSGPIGAMARRRGDVVSMIRSIRAAP